MTPNTLFLAWQDKKNRGWFPVGRLDVNSEPHYYRFRYLHGAKRAEEKLGFPPIHGFPSFEGDYRSPQLFPLFKNRVIAQNRPDRGEYLRNLDLSEDADPIEVLSVNGGKKTTDVYEVFPKISKREDGSFSYKFFLHGSRHVPSNCRQRIENLAPKERLLVALELTNPVTGFAVQIQTSDYCTIGWSPRCLVDDFVAAMEECPSYSAHVVRLNPLPAPSRQRLLIQLDGRWEKHSPMCGPDFTPLVGQMINRIYS